MAEGFARVRINGEVRELADKEKGLVLVTGPTGSGKSTSLYAFLHEINTIDQRILTAEEPIEYQMAGVNQVLVRPERLQRYNVTLDQVVQAARQATGFGGAGFLETANQRLPIRQRPRIESPADLRGLPESELEPLSLALLERERRKDLAAVDVLREPALDAEARAGIHEAAVAVDREVAGPGVHRLLALLEDDQRRPEPDQRPSGEAPRAPPTMGVQTKLKTMGSRRPPNRLRGAP